MATSGRTQKQIAERYKGNLGYYKRKHPWRVARWCANLLAIAGGIAGIVLFQKRGNEEFFSSGKISSSHAAFAQDCAKCHDKSATLGDRITRCTNRTWSRIVPAQSAIRNTSDRGG